VSTLSPLPGEGGGGEIFSPAKAICAQEIKLFGLDKLIRFILLETSTLAYFLRVGSYLIYLVEYYFHLEPEIRKKYVRNFS
jgi:hypothetical protein